MGRFKFGLESLNCDGRRGMALATACALLLAVAAAGDDARLALRYDRVALADGEWWRLVTAHLVHLSFGHAALNAAGLALVWVLFARDYRLAQWMTIVIAAIAAVDAGLWLFQPEVSWYVGGSGLLHAAMAAGALAHIRRREADGWVLMAFLIGKLAYEQLDGAMPFSSGLGRVIVGAHLYGALAGLCVALLWSPRRPL